eukprot:UN29972
MTIDNMKRKAFQCSAVGFSTNGTLFNKMDKMDKWVGAEAGEGMYIRKETCGPDLRPVFDEVMKNIDASSKFKVLVQAVETKVGFNIRHNKHLLKNWLMEGNDAQEEKEESGKRRLDPSGLPNPKRVCKDNPQEEEKKKPVLKKDGVPGFPKPKIEKNGWIGFWLCKTKNVQEKYNNMALSLQDILSGDMKHIIMYNYKIDLQWVIQTCPQILVVNKIDVVHGARTHVDHELMKESVSCYKN